ncbi:unnamed protein product, partial [Protopolystoma xenopodis]
FNGKSEDCWPPFQRVGTCHSSISSIHPRLSVSQLLLKVIASPVAGLSEPLSPCLDTPNSELTIQSDTSSGPVCLLVGVGGVAGQVSLWRSLPCTPAHICPTVATAAVIKRAGTFEPDVAKIQVDLLADIEDRDTKFVWRPCSDYEPYPIDALKAREGPVPVDEAITTQALIHPIGLIQLHPPACITALSIEPLWQVAAVGTPHGFALIDLLSRSLIHSHCLLKAHEEACEATTLEATATTGSGSSLRERGKLLKASIRQSFKRLKKSATTPRRTQAAPSATLEEAQTTHDSAADVQPIEATIVTEAIDAAKSVATAAGEAITGAVATTAETVCTVASHTVESVTGAVVDAVQPQNVSTKPATSSEAETSSSPTATVPAPLEPIHLGPFDTTSARVCSFLFTDTQVITPRPAQGHPSSSEYQPPVLSYRTPALLVGTAGGAVLVHSLFWPNETQGGPVSVQIIKELQLKHAAPVLGMAVWDSKAKIPIFVANGLRRR